MLYFIFINFSFQFCWYSDAGSIIGLTKRCCGLHSEIRNNLFTLLQPVNTAIRYGQYLPIDEVQELTAKCPALRATNDTLITKITRATTKRNIELNITGEQSHHYLTLFPGYLVSLSSSPAYINNKPLTKQLSFIYVNSWYNQCVFDLFYKFKIEKCIFGEVRQLHRIGRCLYGINRKLFGEIFENKEYVNLNKHTLPFLCLNIAEETLQNGSGDGVAMSTSQGRHEQMKKMK